MEAITQTEPVVTVTDTETIEFSIDLPGVEDYVPCEQCEATVKDGRIASTRSYMFFFYKDGLFSFCKHHGERNQARLEELGGTLVLDTRDRLIENRLQGLS